MTEHDRISLLQNQAIHEAKLKRAAEQNPAVRELVAALAAKDARIAELEAALAAKDAVPEADAEEQPDEPARPKKGKRADA